MEDRLIVCKNKFKKLKKIIVLILVLMEDRLIGEEIPGKSGEFFKVLILVLMEDRLIVVYNDTI